MKLELAPLLSPRQVFRLWPPPPLLYTLYVYRVETRLNQRARKGRKERWMPRSWRSSGTEEN